MFSINEFMNKGELMLSGLSNNNATNFKALSIKPKASEWNKEVLDAALESRIVQDFVKHSADKKEDVVMSLSDTIPDGCIPYGYRILNFKLNSKGQSLSLKSVAKPMMKKHEVVYTDIYGEKEKDVAKDMAEQLRNFGVVKSGDTEAEKIKNLYILGAFKK